MKRLAQWLTKNVALPRVIFFYLILLLAIFMSTTVYFSYQAGKVPQEKIMILEHSDGTGNIWL